MARDKRPEAVTAVRGLPSPGEFPLCGGIAVGRPRCLRLTVTAGLNLVAVDLPGDCHGLSALGFRRDGKSKLLPLNEAGSDFASFTVYLSCGGNLLKALFDGDVVRLGLASFHWPLMFAGTTQKYTLLPSTTWWASGHQSPIAKA